MKKNKFDLFNFFYSIGAVVILVGVIAKFLEWKLQDAFLLTGLGVEAMVFTMSSIQYKKEEKKYRWEKVFPELGDEQMSESAPLSGKPAMEAVQEQYVQKMLLHIAHLDELNSGLTKYGGSYTNGAELLTEKFSESGRSITELNENLNRVAIAFGELKTVQTKMEEIADSFQRIKIGSSGSAQEIDRLQTMLTGLNQDVQIISSTTNGIISQFKRVSA